MQFVPHPPLYLSQIRIVDIWCLLILGAIWEILTRLVLFTQKRKPSDIQAREIQLKDLERETERKRRMGPPAFVETSKLERQVLALKRELEEQQETRKSSTEWIEKKVVKRSNLLMTFLIFVLYYGVPLITVQEMEAPSISTTSNVNRKGYLKSILFPVNTVGLGSRLARLGMPADIAFNSLGALMVFWSAQVTVGKLMDAFEAYFL